MVLFLIFILLLLHSSSAQINAKRGGAILFEDGDIAIVLYLPLENTGQENYQVSVRSIDCVELTHKGNQSSSMYLIGGEMGTLFAQTTRNVTFIYPNLYLINRRGDCKVAIRYQNDNKASEFTHHISYRTRHVQGRISPDTDPGSKLPQCATSDQDPFEDCNPVDCMIKYSGEKSFFNKDAQTCQYVTACKCSDMWYSLITNMCKDLNVAVSKGDLEDIEKNEGKMCNCNQIANMVCHHGAIRNETGDCECLTDWVTSDITGSYEPSLQQYHVCNVEVNAWNAVNRSKLETTILLIAIFAVTIASKIVIIMCIITWCLKWAKKKKPFCEFPPDSDCVCENHEADDCPCNIEELIITDVELQNQLKNSNPCIGEKTKDCACDAKEIMKADKNIYCASIEYKFNSSNKAHSKDHSREDTSSKILERKSKSDCLITETKLNLSKPKKAKSENSRNNHTKSVHIEEDLKVSTKKACKDLNSSKSGSEKTFNVNYVKRPRVPKSPPKSCTNSLTTTMSFDTESFSEPSESEDDDYEIEFSEEQTEEEETGRNLTQIDEVDEEVNSGSK